MALFENSNFITLKEDTHQYFDTNGDEYTPLSRVLNTVKVPFDKEGISNRMAKGDPIEKQRLLKEWADKANGSIDHGNRIHKAMEDYLNMKPISDIALSNLAKEFSSELKGYDKVRPEQVIYLRDLKIAGTTDLALERQKKSNVVDFFDYKTNLERGIYFDSISRKNGETKHFNKYLLDPLSHLEECNYNTYALQLSGYGYMAEKTFGIRVGKLFIVYIYMKNKNEYDYRMLPVPYMKYEVEALFNSFSKLKKLC